MTKAITQGIEISVATVYMAKRSNPKAGLYFFMYEILIENKNEFSIQLLKRHWDIFDSNGDYRVVDGDGVVGENPILHPGQSYKYTSGCNLCSEVGKMSGYYTMKRLSDFKNFNVSIPEFYLVTPGKLN